MQTEYYANSDSYSFVKLAKYELDVGFSNFIRDSISPINMLCTMKTTQLTKGENKRVMYIENKDGLIDSVSARIGWVSFSKTGNTVYYQDKTLRKIKGGGIRGNFRDTETEEEYWISGIKKTGSNAHWAEPVNIVVDEDAIVEYTKIKNGT